MDVLGPGTDWLNYDGVKLIVESGSDQMDQFCRFLVEMGIRGDI